MDMDNCTPYNTVYLDDPADASFYLYNLIDKIVGYYILPVICVFGILSNVFFIVVVFRVHFMQTPTSCYLVQLSVADIVFLLVAAVQTMFLISSTPLRFDISPLGLVGGCILGTGLLHVPYFASLFLITAVTFDRYIAICRPLRIRLYTSSRRIKLSTALWVIAVVYTACLVPVGVTVLCVVPPNDSLSTDKFTSAIAICGSKSVPDWLFYLRKALQASPFVITLAVNVVFYVAILRAIRKRNNVQGTSTKSRRQREQTRSAVDRMVLVTGGLFFLLLSPLECYFIVISITEVIGFYPLTAEQEVTVIWVCRLVAYVNSAINPIVYNITNSRYREAFKLVFWNKTSQTQNSNRNTSNIDKEWTKIDSGESTTRL